MFDNEKEQKVYIVNIEIEIKKKIRKMKEK